jgi:hypothetical protein
MSPHLRIDSDRRHDIEAHAGVVVAVNPNDTCISQTFDELTERVAWTMLSYASCGHFRRVRDDADDPDRFGHDLISVDCFDELVNENENEIHRDESEKHLTDEISDALCHD